MHTHSPDLQKSINVAAVDWRRTSSMNSAPGMMFNRNQIFYKSLQCLYKKHFLMSQCYFQLSIKLLYDHNKLISYLKINSLSTLILNDQSVHNLKMYEQIKSKKVYLITIQFAFKGKISLSNCFSNISIRHKFFRFWV